MAKYVFLYRVANSDDRDACAYIETRNGEARFSCNHYFSGVNIHGACYFGGSHEPFENIETVLTADEYNKLWQIDSEIDALGSGITKGDDRYKKGIALCAELQTIIDKLQSDEGQRFFADIVADEKQRIMDEHNLTEDEADDIFNTYGMDYQDRAIVAAVWNDTTELAEEFAEDCLDIPDNLKQYFDYTKLGDDMLNDGNYYELSDGRVVEFAY